jgi:hypothetical protein
MFLPARSAGRWQRFSAAGGVVGRIEDWGF